MICVAASELSFSLHTFVFTLPACQTSVPVRQTSIILFRWYCKFKTDFYRFVWLAFSTIRAAQISITLLSEFEGTSVISMTVTIEFAGADPVGSMISIVFSSDQTWWAINYIILLKKEILII